MHARKFLCHYISIDNLIIKKKFPLCKGNHEIYTKHLHVAKVVCDNYTNKQFHQKCQ